MSLVKCKKCSTIFKESEKVCPECGLRLSRKSLGCGSALGIIFLVVTVTVILESFDKNSSEKNLEQATISDTKESNTEKVIVSKWLPQIEELCKDWAYYKAKVYKYSMEGNDKEAKKASLNFKSITNELSRYPDNDVYETCAKYDTPEFMEKYMR